jgi:hypothetical protein
MKIKIDIDTGDDNYDTGEIIKFVTNELAPRIKYLIEEEVCGTTGKGSQYNNQYSYNVKCTPTFAQLKKKQK